MSNQNESQKNGLGKTYRCFMYFLLGASTVNLALSGFVAPFFKKNLEEVFVLSSALANSIALLAISGIIYTVDFNSVHRIKIRVLLTIETILFCAILSFDIQHFFGIKSIITMLIALGLAIVPVVTIAFTKKPYKYIGGLVTALLFSISLYLMPAIIDKTKPFVFPLVKYLANLLTDADIVKPYNFVRLRINSLIHLIVIPLIYLTFDTYLSRFYNVLKKNLPCNTGLFVVGIGCTTAGSFVDNPLFEAGAAAVIMLLGNWWFLNIDN